MNEDSHTDTHTHRVYLCQHTQSIPLSTGAESSGTHTQTRQMDYISGSVQSLVVNL